MEVFRTPDERFEGLPGYSFEPHYTEVDGLRMHYVDEGAGDPVVCFHGEPTLGLPLPQDAAAAGGGRAPGDLPRLRRLRALGQADRPRLVHLRPPRGDGLGGAGDARPVDATVVVQDWGGPIGLRWAVENADRVARLVILNTGLFTGRVSKGFMAWRDFAERNPDLPVGFVVQGATATELPDEVVAAYEAPFPNAGVEGRRRHVPAARAHRGGRARRRRDGRGDGRAARAGRSRR